jgi:hypothetical protein
MQLCRTIFHESNVFTVKTRFHKFVGKKLLFTLEILIISSKLLPGLIKIERYDKIGPLPNQQETTVAIAVQRTPLDKTLLYLSCARTKLRTAVWTLEHSCTESRV